MKTLYTILLGISLLALSGCKDEVKPEPIKPACPLPSGHNLEAAIDQGIETIQGCPQKYDEVFETLVDIAAEKKSVDNPKKLLRLSKLAIKDNLLPADETQYQFRLYFAKSIVSVPTAKVSTKSQCRRMDQIKSDINAELEKKKIGYEKVMGDKEGYLRIRNRAKEFTDSFEIICSSFDE